MNTMTELEVARLRGELIARLHAPGYLTRPQAERHADVVLEVFMKTWKALEAQLATQAEPVEYDVIHKASGRLHRRVRAGERLVLDSWEERECEVRALPAPCQTCGGTGAGTGQAVDSTWCSACDGTGSAAIAAPSR